MSSEATSKFKLALYEKLMVLSFMILNCAMRPTVYSRFVRIGRMYFGLLIVFVLAINLPWGSGRLLGLGGVVLWGVLTVALVMSISEVFDLLPMRRKLNRAMSPA
jgi:hypothetical protein